jgi:hypothetical protein
MSREGEDGVLHRLLNEDEENPRDVRQDNAHRTRIAQLISSASFWLFVIFLVLVDLTIFAWQVDISCDSIYLRLAGRLNCLLFCTTCLDADF